MYIYSKIEDIPFLIYWMLNIALNLSKFPDLAKYAILSNHKIATRHN